MNLELEYDDAGVGPLSRLSVQQRSEFYRKIEGSVWKITVKIDKQEETDKDKNKIGMIKIYTGVCVMNGKFILTTYFDEIDQINNIRVCSSEGIEYTPIASYHDESLGLSLLELEVQSKYIKIGCTTCIDLGSNLYALAYGQASSSPMLFMGKCVLPYYTNPPSSMRYRIPDEISDEYCPKGLGKYITLIQVDNLHCANIGSFYMEGTSVGIESGIGSPVFNSKGHLLGIVSFQIVMWNMIIPSNYIEEFIERHRNQGSTSKKEEEVRKRKKSKKTRSNR